MNNERIKILKSSYGTPNYPSNTDKRVLILLEDTGNAFNFYYNYLLKNYTISNADIIGVGGNTRFSEILQGKYGYDSYIIIYDRGIDTKRLREIRKTIEDLRMHTKSKINLFTPNCFEEVLLSFKILENYIGINKYKNSYELYRQLQLLLDGKIDSVDYFKKEGDIKSIEKVIEHVLEELTRETVFEYRHGDRKGAKPKMSDCWIYDCCQVDPTTERNRHLENLKEKCTKINLQGESNKLALIANNSLLGALSNILNEVFGYNKPKKLNKMSLNEYNKLVGEVI